MPNKHTPSHSKLTVIAPMAVKLDAELKSRLEHLSLLKDRSTHWLMKQAIERYVSEEEQTEALKQETLRRWMEEAELNITVPHEDVMTLLDTWGKKDEESSR